MRILVVWCPDWPVLSHLAEIGGAAPVAVLEKGRVLACSPQARADGVRRGMRRRDAQARCPEVVLRDHRPDADARAFDDILVAVEAISPAVSPIRPGLLALAVPSRYYGGESEAAAVIAECLVGLGVWDVRCGIADTMFAAEQAARRAPAQECVVVQSRRTTEFLAPLPIEVIDTVPDESGSLVDLLRRLGLRTLGDFAALPAPDVHTRFGSRGSLLHRLASGHDPRPVARRQVPPDLSVTTPFEPPLDRVEAVAFSLRTAAEGFVAHVADRGGVVTAVRIEVVTDRGEEYVRVWRHPRWFSSADLVDRVRWQLESGRVEERTGAVAEVRLVPELVEPVGDHAEGLFGGGPDEQVERGVARVQSMVGPEAVRSAGVQGGRSPRDRQLVEPWGEKPPSTRPVARPWPGSIPPPAPATVFADPSPAMVVGAEGQSVGVSGRGGLIGVPVRFRATAESTWQPVAAWAGPWPVDDQWWDEAAARRVARFQVVGVDGSAWLMVVENGQWWTEARYD